MDQNLQEYITFQTTTKDGTVVEMAVVDEFEFENKHYIAAALIENDTILEDGRYLYRCIVKEDGDFEVEKITREFEYKRIAQAYMEME